MNTEQSMFVKDRADRLIDQVFALEMRTCSSSSNRSATPSPIMLKLFSQDSIWIEDRAGGCHREEMDHVWILNIFLPQKEIVK